MASEDRQASDAGLQFSSGILALILWGKGRKDCRDSSSDWQATHISMTQAAALY